MSTPSRPVVLGFLLLALASPSSPLWASEEDDQLVRALKAYVPEAMAQRGTPGVSLALARSGRQVWAGGFGFADLARKTPMKASTVFRSGSMGKLYVATAVLQLVERGVLQLKDPVSKYLPELKIKNSLGGREPRILDYLTHRSGLSKNAAGSTFAAPQALEAHLREGYRAAHFPSYGGKAVPRWSSRAGTTFAYSNFGIATLGYLVERTNPERLSFSDYVLTKIMRPLGMTSSCYPTVQRKGHAPSRLLARCSTGYLRIGGVLMPTPEIAFADYPAGTALLTVEDHLRFVLAFGAARRGRPLLKPTTWKAMLTPQVALGKDSALGLVWFLRRLTADDANFGHAGAHMYGWRNDCRVYTKQGFSLVVATNVWDVGRRGNPADKDVTTLIAEFVSRWLRARPKAKPRTWAWKRSYVQGLLVCEKLRGALGIAQPIGRERLEAMIAGARAASSANWAPEAFRRGVLDMEGTGLTLAGIRTFLTSARCAVPYAELELITRDLGCGGLPATWRGVGSK